MVARVMANVVLYVGVLFSLTLLLAGHNEPGGGFVAGAMTASVFALLYLVYGREYVETRFHVDYRSIAAAGLLVTVLFALLPTLFGRPVLTSMEVSLSVILLGEFKLSTAVGFDFGIYLAVVGSILTILRRGSGEGT